MAFRRLEGWELALSRFLTVRQTVPFAWGSNDCALFAADAVLAMTRIDPARQWRGYETQEAAEAIIAEAGSLAELITSCLGCEPHRAILHARRGDIALAELTHGPTAAVIDDTGARLAVVDAEGLKRIPLARAKLIWSF